MKTTHTNIVDAMKRMILPFATGASLIAALLAMVGCTALPSGDVLTLKQTQINVSWKMTAYQQAVNGGSVTAAEAQRVAAAKEAYQQAFKQALADAGDNLKTPTPPKLQALVDQLLAAVNDVLTTVR